MNPECPKCGARMAAVLPPEAPAPAPSDEQLLDAFVAGCNREMELQDAELAPATIRAGVAAAMREALGASGAPAGEAPRLAALLHSERVFLAARDVAEIEYRKHADAGVSVGGSVTAATRAALDVAIGAIFDDVGASGAPGRDAPSEQEIDACIEVISPKHFGRQDWPAPGLTRGEIAAMIRALDRVRASRGLPAPPSEEEIEAAPRLAALLAAYECEEYPSGAPLRPTVIAALERQATWLEARGVSVGRVSADAGPPASYHSALALYELELAAAELDKPQAEWRWDELRRVRIALDMLRGATAGRAEPLSDPLELSLKPEAGTPERDALTRVTIPLAEYRLLVNAYRESVGAVSRGPHE